MKTRAPSQSLAAILIAANDGSRVGFGARPPDVRLPGRSVVPTDVGRVPLDKHPLRAQPIRDLLECDPVAVVARHGAAALARRLDGLTERDLIRFAAYHQIPLPRMRAGFEPTPQHTLEAVIAGANALVRGVDVNTGEPTLTTAPPPDPDRQPRRLVAPGRSQSAAPKPAAPAEAPSSARALAEHFRRHAAPIKSTTQLAPMHAIPKSAAVTAAPAQARPVARRPAVRPVEAE